MGEVLAILGHVVPTVTSAGQAIVNTLKRQAGYLLHYRRNVDNFNAQVEELKRRRNDVQEMVNADHRKMRGIFEAVTVWLGNVEPEVIEAFEEDAKRLDELQETIRCFDLRLRYHLGKEAEKKKADVELLNNEGKELKMVSYTPPPPSMESSPGRDFTAFNATESTINEVIDALKDDSINLIGVYGMGGAGKTTLIEEVARKVRRDGLFHKVVMVSLPQKPDLKTIQGDIAEEFGFPLTEHGESIRARKLRERIEQEEGKKILIVLDNLWETLKLEKDVGIPIQHKHQICKIVYTTRSLEICSGMKSQVNIPVNLLSYAEAWNLFKENAGHVVETPAFHAVAREVAEECGGLPLAIVTIASSLKDKDQDIWRDALVKLQRSNINNLDEKVSSRIELSYNYLKNEEAKSCFLLCCLFPDGYSIGEEAMLNYGMGAGLFNGIYTLEEARRRVHTLFDELKSCCLLLEGYIENYVKMHDIVRDVAVLISSRDGSLVQAGTRLEAWEEMGSWKECKRISLAENQINSLPDQIDCPGTLNMLLLQGNPLNEIPYNFFKRMTELTVLDLSRTTISFLPPSLLGLTNLRALLLDSCHNLKDVTGLGRLKKLQILRLQRSGICVLAEQIGELANLKLLDLSYTEYLEIVEPNAISRLTRLEELYMGCSFSIWQVNTSRGVRQASFSEISSLRRLTILNIHVKNINRLHQDIDVPLRNLKKFRICVGGEYTSNESERSLKFENLSSAMPNWANLLLERVYELDLVQCNGLKNVRKSHGPGFNSLEVLYIKKCDEMRHIARVEEEEGPNMLEEPSVLGGLKVLQLVSLPKITCIWKGPIPIGSLGNLKQITVTDCESLIYLFTPYLEERLHKLEKLILHNCEKMEKLMGPEEDTNNASYSRSRHCHLPQHGMFQNLQTLSIYECPGLKNLFTLSIALGLQQLRFLEIWSCRRMEAIIAKQEEDVVDKGIFPRLETLLLENLPQLTSFYQGDGLFVDRTSLNTLELEDDSLKARVQQLIHASDQVGCLDRSYSLHHRYGFEEAVPPYDIRDGRPDECVIM